jgi:hypothetical protein
VNLSSSKILALFILSIVFDSAQINAQWTSYPYHKFNTGYEAHHRSLFEQIDNEIFTATQDDSLEYLGRWGWGRCYGVAAMGNYVFTGSGPTLLWLDLTDKRRPVVVWDTIKNTSVIESYTNARGFAIQDSIGYAIMKDKLVVVDFRNPTAPAIIGELLLSTSAATLVVEGSFVFVARAYGGLYIVDVSNPYSPYLRNVVAEPAALPNLAITNHNLYIVDGNGLLTYYINVSNPDNAYATQLYL